jgi:hypothetical protein
MNLYLMQRLEPTDELNQRAYQAFGGGNLGLTADGWRFFSGLCNIAYMGSAEYEFGALPDFMRKVVERRKSLKAFSFVLLPGEYTASYDRLSRRHGKEVKMGPLQLRGVYVICHEDVDPAELEIALRRVFLAKQSVKGDAHVSYAFDPGKDRHRVLGWLCYGAKSMVFADRQLFEALAERLERQDLVESVPRIDVLERTNWAAMTKPQLMAAASQLFNLTATDLRKLKKSELVERMQRHEERQGGVQ